MFLSLSTSAWILIAAGATVVNLAAMQWIIQIPKYRKKQFWVPVVGLVALGARGLAQHNTLAETLYLYAAVLIMFPLILAPVRGTITRDYYRWVEDPLTKASKGAMTWIAVSATILMIAIGAGYAAGA
ncbi:hypothetical protein GT045_24410 [Streptomyces sp. SID486]|uniref:hypothetical protein n=1 Tax=unclassified Streptomyces TaxID=2593676 RepID=UPI0013682EA0|nr:MULTISPECIES: hypothetical protein [unclassified Streptomyces]MYW15961.1 hypothetical protein [Streptomyces sp. SID2955]MYW47531.1 hypothetical protein [Streptomyces sp. SID161]MYX97869.1 hypothetical protein [Streptomyces sp. SID486]